MRGGVLMHAYLKTIGFSKIKTTKELQEILRDVVENYDRKKIVETEEHHLFAEFSKEYAYDCGITVCGEIDENNRFQMEYYYPYFEGGRSAPTRRYRWSATSIRNRLQAPATICGLASR